MPDLHTHLTCLRNESTSGVECRQPGTPLDKLFWRAHLKKQLLLIDRVLDLKDDRARQQYLRQIAGKGEAHD